MLEDLVKLQTVSQDQTEKRVNSINERIKKNLDLIRSVNQQYPEKNEDLPEFFRNLEKKSNCIK